MLLGNLKRFRNFKKKIVFYNVVCLCYMPTNSNIASFYKNVSALRYVPLVRKKMAKAMIPKRYVTFLSIQPLSSPGNLYF